jgi:hypothetical protein
VMAVVAAVVVVRVEYVLVEVDCWTRPPTRRTRAARDECKHTNTCFKRAFSNRMHTRSGSTRLS